MTEFNKNRTISKTSCNQATECCPNTEFSRNFRYSRHAKKLEEPLSAIREFAKLSRPTSIGKCSLLTVPRLYGYTPACRMCTVSVGEKCNPSQNAPVSSCILEKGRTIRLCYQNLLIVILLLLSCLEQVFFLTRNGGQWSLFSNDRYAGKQVKFKQFVVSINQYFISNAKYCFDQTFIYCQIDTFYQNNAKFLISSVTKKKLRFIYIKKRIFMSDFQTWERNITFTHGSTGGQSHAIADSR